MGYMEGIGGAGVCGGMLGAFCELKYNDSPGGLPTPAAE